MRQQQMDMATNSNDGTSTMDDTTGNAFDEVRRRRDDDNNDDDGDENDGNMIEYYERQWDEIWTTFMRDLQSPETDFHAFSWVYNLFVGRMTLFYYQSNLYRLQIHKYWKSTVPFFAISLIVLVIISYFSCIRQIVIERWCTTSCHSSLSSSSTTTSTDTSYIHPQQINENNTTTVSTTPNITTASDAKNNTDMSSSSKQQHQWCYWMLFHDSMVLYLTTMIFFHFLSACFSSPGVTLNQQYSTIIVNENNNGNNTNATSFSSSSSPPSVIILPKHLQWTATKSQGGCCGINPILNIQLERKRSLLHKKIMMMTTTTTMMNNKNNTNSTRTTTTTTNTTTTTDSDGISKYNYNDNNNNTTTTTNTATTTTDPNPNPYFPDITWTKCNKCPGTGTTSSSNNNKPTVSSSSSVPEVVLRPPRCHHCTICNRCVLQYDHHCIWLNNCIGFYNYRNFVCLLFYLSIGCWYGSMVVLFPHLYEYMKQQQFDIYGFQFQYENGTGILDLPTPYKLLLSILGGNVDTIVIVKMVFPLLFLVGISLTIFFFYHLRYILEARTTLESKILLDRQYHSLTERQEIYKIPFNPFDHGWYVNFQNAMGPLLYIFLPINVEPKLVSPESLDKKGN